MPRGSRARPAQLKRCVPPRPPCRRARAHARARGADARAERGGAGVGAAGVGGLDRCPSRPLLSIPHPSDRPLPCRPAPSLIPQIVRFRAAPPHPSSDRPLPCRPAPSLIPQIVRFRAAPPHPSSLRSSASVPPRPIPDIVCLRPSPAAAAAPRRPRAAAEAGWRAGGAQGATRNTGPSALIPSGASRSRPFRPRSARPLPTSSPRGLRPAPPRPPHARWVLRGECSSA